MKRIRIGNDIRVQTSLHDLNDFDITSIKQLRCYFIPQGDSYTTPNTDTYDPMQYTICNCGKPKYNVFPCNIDAPHWFCCYNGFGVNSKRFIHVDNKFLAPSRLLAEQNRIEAYFPAKAQHQIGEYKFVIVLTIYQPGWCEDNLRTITLDEGVIFALTSDDRDTDTDTIIDLDIAYIKSITVPDKLKLENELQINIGNLDYDDVPYIITLNYSDGSNKSITASEFNNLLNTSIDGNSGISIDENGQITRTDKFKDINTEITYYLKEDPSIVATMQVVSVGKWHTIEYNHLNVIEVNGPEDLFVNNDYLDYPYSGVHLASFTARTAPGVSSTIIVERVTGDGCTIEKSTQDSNTFYICPSITKDNITINITNSSGFEEPDVDEEHTYTIQYTYDNTQYTVNGPSEVKILNSELSTDKLIGSLNITCIGENTSVDNIQVTAAGCNVKSIATQETIHTYKLCGPITATSNIIQVNITTKQNSRVTSIVVPDSIMLQHTSHLNIGDLGYDGTAYNVRINYSDGSHKLVSADEFSELITVVTNDADNIVIGETGQIRRLNMFKNVDEQVTYQLKEDSSIKDTMRIVSSGKMYIINYNYDSNYVTVDGKTSRYVDDTTKIGDALPVSTFTVIPTNNEYTMTSLDMEITGASLINKPDPNTSVTRAEVTIVTPVTSDEITITITASQFRP